MTTIHDIDFGRLYREHLAAWYRADPERARLVDAPRCWAFVSWETTIP
jgi:hypothetical protein